MKIRVTVTPDEMKKYSFRDVRVYKNKDGSYRLYFNSLDEFMNAVAQQ